MLNIFYRHVPMSERRAAPSWRKPTQHPEATLNITKFYTLENGVRSERQPSRRELLIGAAAALSGFAASPAYALSPVYAQGPASAQNPASTQNNDAPGLSHSAGSIHQEPTFPFSRKLLYEALTDAAQFDKVMRLGVAMRSMATGTTPAQIDRNVGGSFLIFGGYISGRHLELVPNERIVQAWRPQSWKPGEYSVVKFDLVEQGSGSKLIFDQRGFPDGTGEHLSVGWSDNYWEPLRKYLSSR